MTTPHEEPRIQVDFREDAAPGDLARAVVRSAWYALRFVVRERVTRWFLDRAAAAYEREDPGD